MKAYGSNARYKRARETWRSLTGDTNQEAQHKFRWEPATGRVAAGWQLACRASSDLRAMSSRAAEIAALTKKGYTINKFKINILRVKNQKVAAQPHLAMAGVNTSALISWCKEVGKATRDENPDRTTASKKIVDKKARAIEDAESKRRANEWRSAMTRKTQGKKHAHWHALSRLAYRWARGPAGWNHASMVNDSAHTAIPDLHPGAKPYDEVTNADGEAANHHETQST